MDRGAVLEANVARAKEFADKFPELKVGHVGSIKDASAMAVHHNSESGWGFTVQFLTTADGNNHTHAWLEFVGGADRADEVVERFKKALCPA